MRTIDGQSLELPSLQEITTDFDSPSQLPGYLRVSLLEACNEKCFFCHNEGFKGSATKRLSPNIFYQTVDASVRLGKVKFKFTGGEPTLDDRLPKYINYIKNIAPDSEVGIVTNATLLTQCGDALIDAGLDSIVVSLHSVTPSGYNQVTGVNACEDALTGIEYMKSKGMDNITINCVVSTLNIHELDDIVAYCSTLGLNLRLLDILPVDQYSTEVRIPPETMKQLHPEITVKPKKYHSKCENCGSKAICGEGEYLRLSASGFLIPCMYRDDLKIHVLPTDSPYTTLLKTALGFRRIWFDNL